MFRPLAPRHPQRTSQLLIGGVLAAVMLTGCASTGSVPGTEPAAPGDLPEGWVMAIGDTPASVPGEAPDLPVTVTDATDTQVEINDATKIIAGGDDIAATLAGLGLADNIFAAPDDSSSQAGRDAPEHFAFNKNSGAEGLLAMQGTLFIGNNPSRHGDVAAQFRNAGVPAVVIDDQWDAPTKIRAIGEYVGLAESADTLADEVEGQMNEAAAEGVEGMRVLNVTASGAGGANAVVGTGTPSAAVLEHLGAISVGVEAGLRGYSVDFSDEGLLGAQPEAIVITTADLEKWGGPEGLWEAFPTLDKTPAGQQGNVIVMDPDQIKYTSPATGTGAIALAGALASIGHEH